MTPTKEQLRAVCDHLLTVEKVQHIIERDGAVVSGFVLQNPTTGTRAIVELSAVRCLKNEEMWNLMHGE